MKTKSTFKYNFKGGNKFNILLKKKLPVILLNSKNRISTP